MSNCPRCELLKDKLLVTAKHGAMCEMCIDKVYSRVLATLNVPRVVGEYKEVLG